MIGSKGEGRASTILISLLIVVFLMIWFSTFITQMAGDYGVTDVPEFKAFEETYNESVPEGVEVIESQSGNFTIQEGERQEDTIFRTGLRTIRLAFKSFGIFSSAFESSETQLNLITIPPVVKATILVILGLSMMFMIAKAFWRYSDI